MCIETKGYLFLQHTLLDGVLPGTETVLAHHHLESSPLIHEPGISAARIDRAHDFFSLHKYAPMIFHMCNDATALRKTLSHRRADNTLHGLNTLDDVRCPDTLDDLEAIAARYGMASEIDVVLLCPLNPTLPPFVLAVFPQQHLLSAHVHLRRWGVLEQLLAERGMYVVTHGVDGAAPHLVAEQTRQPDASLPHGSAPMPATSLPRRLASFTYHADQRTHTLSLLVPVLCGHGELFQAVHAPARLIPFRGEQVLLPDLHFQDFCHLGSKLRVRLCGRHAHGVILGNGRASIFLLLQEMNSDLWRLMAVGARAGDFDPQRDPMNLPAFFRLTSDDMLAYLRVRAQTLPAQAPAVVVPSVASRSADAMHWTTAQLRYVLNNANLSTFDNCLLEFFCATITLCIGHVQTNRSWRPPHSHS